MSLRQKTLKPNPEYKVHLTPHALSPTQISNSMDQPLLAKKSNMFPTMPVSLNLHFLVSLFIPNDLPEEEHAIYSAALGTEWPNIIVGQLTLWKQRNFITKHFPEGTHIVSMDDDVDGIYQLREGEKGNTLQLLEEGFLEKIILDAEKKMKRQGSTVGTNSR